MDDKIEQAVFYILEEFEELLDIHQIDIPDSNREGGAMEARLYGDEYYTLEEKIKDIVKKLIKVKNEN